VDFSFFVDDERIRVKFVASATLGKLSASKHSAAGDYHDRTIRLFRGEPRRTQRSVMLHELGHYLFARMELRAGRASEEDICDLFTWMPLILEDPRNSALRKFLGLTLS
jgi:hypothetical protein